MATERCIVSEIDHAAFDAWYGTVNKPLEILDRIGQGQLIVDNIIGIVKGLEDHGRYLVQNDGSFYFTFGDNREATYKPSKVEERLTLVLGTEKLLVRLAHRKNGIVDGHIRYESNAGSTDDDVYSVNHAHDMVDCLEELFVF